jgi:hypothetical protein
MASSISSKHAPQLTKSFSAAPAEPSPSYSLHSRDSLMGMV